MRKVILILCICCSIFLLACKPDPIQEPDPANNPTENSNTTDDTLSSVKKYLVREFHPFDTLSDVRSIQWNNDFSRILHITIRSNTPYQVDFDFTYYEADSFQVHLSKPVDGWSLVLFTDYTCHLDSDGRISTIDYYFNSDFQSTEQYQYDESGHLVQETQYWGGDSLVGGCRFEWDGDNVTAVYSVSGELGWEYHGFNMDAIHPHSTMPHLLRCGDTYSFLYITEPLWKNWYANDNDFLCECDEDGYVISQYRLDENGEKKAITNFEYNY